MDDERLMGFEPIVDMNSRVLILGSLPGTESLRLSQYYAYSRNQFWRLVGCEDSDYSERCKALLAKNIAVWDVIESAQRIGAADSKITSEKPNDFKEFFQKYNHITHIFFNGKKAETCFMKYYEEEFGHIIKSVLPSSSPANAGQNFEEKLKKWQIINDVLKR